MDFDDESVLSGVLLPVQFYSAGSPTPYHHLLAAILEDAIRCFQKNCGACSVRRHTMFREAEEWLFDSRGTAFTSSLTVCESLGIDPIQIRRYLRKWKLNKQAGRPVRPVGRIRLTATVPTTACTVNRALSSKLGKTTGGMHT
jgi:hypothetical protein